MPTVFFSYSHTDEDLRNQLDTQLSALKRQGIIETWHDRRIGAGEDFTRAIDQHVETDDIILLLVSADFIASDYCYEIEMRRAIERHEAGEAIVIPVILRACDWHGTPFGKLNATPPDGKPITQYADRDQAMLEVARAVREAAARLSGSTQAKRQAAPRLSPASPSIHMPTVSPRSSNLVLARSFTDRDRDAFKHDSYKYLARFFENSLKELAARNPGIQGIFKRIDANRFTAAIYENGTAIARCTIFLGDRTFATGIAYSSGEVSTSNSFNELLTVESDDQSLFLRSMGMRSMGGTREAKLTQEGAAEHYWGILIQPLQPQ